MLCCCDDRDPETVDFKFDAGSMKEIKLGHGADEILIKLMRSIEYIIRRERSKSVVMVKQSRVNLKKQKFDL